MDSQTTGEVQTKIPGQTTGATSPSVPVLSLLVSHRLYQALWCPTRKLTRLDTGEWVIRVDDKIIARVEVKEGPALGTVDEVFAVTESLVCHRFVRWIVAQCAQHRDESLLWGSKRICVAGVGGLRQAIGCRSYADSARLKVIVLFFTGLKILGHDGAFKSLLGVEKQGRKLHMLVQDLLLPDYYASIPNTLKSKRIARKLVPVTNFPPLTGRRNEYGAQLTMQWLFMERARLLAVDLAAKGYVSVTADDWERLAIEAGLPLSLIPQLLDGWIQGAHGQEPFLKKAAEDVYSFAPEFKQEQRQLIRAGERERMGNRRGARNSSRKIALNR